MQKTMSVIFMSTIFRKNFRKNNKKNEKDKSLDKGLSFFRI